MGQTTLSHQRIKDDRRGLDVTDGPRLRRQMRGEQVRFCADDLDVSNGETLRTLSWLASKKRQGTKSRKVWHRPCSKSYGDLMLAENSMMGVTAAGCELRIGAQARLGPCKVHFNVVSEHVNRRPPHWGHRLDREGSLPAWSQRVGTGKLRG
jgi:hypothetical protein